MVYMIAAATAGMLGYMLWLLLFRLRRDRVASERNLSRGKHAFRPRERLRFLLNRAFHVPKDKPEWEDPIVSSLANAAAPEAADEVEAARPNGPGA